MAKKKTIADQLASAFIHHDVQLSRLEAHHQKMILKDLKLVEKRLVADLATRAGESFTKARSQALLHDVHETIKTGYKAVYETNKQQLLDLGAYEAKAVPRIVNGVIGAKVMSVGVPQSVIESMVKEDIAIGAPLKTFWGKQAATLQENFTKEVRAGIFAGSTPEQMIQRVRGTKAKSFKDGIMSTSRRGAAAVVRTASQSVLNDARMELYTRNSDVLNGVQVQATLDARTTDICISRSGAAWDNNGDPLPGTDTGEDFPGPPPWHVNCRSTLIPVVKSFGEILDDTELNAKIEEEMKNLPKATQASMDGQVAADLTYEDWLEDQSEEFQKEILGPGKWELWNNEQIGMRDLIDQTGRPMTIKELKQANTFGGGAPEAEVVAADVGEVAPPTVQPPEGFQLEVESDVQTINETPMLHTTDEKYVSSIEKTGLRPSENSIFGRAIYFSDQSLAGQTLGGDTFGNAVFEAKLAPHNQLVIARSEDVTKVFQKMTNLGLNDVLFDKALAERMIKGGYGSAKFVVDGSTYTLVFDQKLITLSKFPATPSVAAKNVQTSVPASVVPPPKGVSRTVDPSTLPKEQWAGFHAEYAGSVKALSKVELDELGNYQGASGIMNSRMRTGDFEVKLQPKIDAIESAIDKATLPHDVTVYRGGSFKNLHESVLNGDSLVGVEIRDKAFMSTSLGRETAIKFTSVATHPVEFEIQAKQGMRAINMNAVNPRSSFLREHEVLFQRDTGMRVVSQEVVKRGKQQIVRLVMETL